MNWDEFTPTSLKDLDDDKLQELTHIVLETQYKERQYNQLYYYKPANEKAGLIHLSNARTIGIGGGNGAGKTDHALVEMVIRATGQIPKCLQHTYPRTHLRGPISCRVVCESLTTTLVPVILPKLQWWKWSGIDMPGEKRGHWGWIPRHCLIDGEWKKSWSERLRILKLWYRDPDKPDRIIGQSTIQFNSYDQDSTDFASGDFHYILHDEPPKHDIWRENRARVMRVDGTMVLAMTWPDNPAIPVDWIFDEIYDKGQPGAGKDPNTDWFNIFTTDNPNLNQEAVALRAGEMSPLERQVRIYGQPIRFSNRIHPLFTDDARIWCFDCGKEVIKVNISCSECSSENITEFNHVKPVKTEYGWPVIFALDPHPRKPHMMMWVQITPNDDLQQVVERSIDGSPADVRDEVNEVESQFGWSVIRRLIDPNMGRSPSGANRELTWQDEFENVGIRCDLADDSEIGRARLNEYMVPDQSTGVSRYVVDPRNTETIFQLKRYIWDDYKRSQDRDISQKPKTKNDDFPTLLKYIMNTDPSFRAIRNMGQVIRRTGTRGKLGY